MIIKNLNLKNFRNFKILSINPNPNLNYIVGDNAQGKTNLVESIYYCSFLKSYRTNNSLNLINNESDNFYLNINVENNNSLSDLKIFFDKRKNRSIKVNNKKPEGNEFYKKINSVIYYPDEINYLNLYPQYRRNYIDRSIFLLDVDYVVLYSKYKKILKNRNNVLKDKDYDTKLDDVWIDVLIKSAIPIIEKRKNYIDKINILLSDDNNYNEQLFIDYDLYDYENLYEFLEEKFKKSLARDIKFGYTTIGPHSDDFIFKINSHDIRKYSSEGQKKSFILKLKKSQLAYYKDIHHHFPILIIDDIANELDKTRKNIHLSDLIENSGQVFITTTDLTDKYDTNCSIFKVANGKVIY